MKDASSDLGKVISAGDSSNHLFNCQFEVYKCNNLYHYNFDLMNKSVVNTLKLYFESDPKNLYKIGVKVMVPDQSGCEKIVYSRIYEENYFSTLCEKSERPEILAYFSQNPN